MEIMAYRCLFYVILLYVKDNPLHFYSKWMGEIMVEENRYEEDFLYMNSKILGK